MKLMKAAAVAAMICILLLSMTGCDALDYRDAIDLYNARDYEAAAEMFYALGDYENCQELYTSCQYWMSVELAQQGNFQEALPRFVKLGTYKNSAQWATECTYQLALAAFSENRFSDAENYFGETPEYKSTGEYLRQITWQNFFDAVAEAPLSLETDEKSYALIADTDANQLVFYVGSHTDAGYTFHSDLTLTVTRDSLIADFTATDGFSMDFRDGAIGSEQIMSGRVDISTCTAQTVPAVEVFEKTVHDNQGNTTTSTDPADSLMTAAMAEDFQALMTVIPELIAEADLAYTLQDIGFSAM